MQCFFAHLIMGCSSFLAQFNMIESATDLQQKILTKKNYIIAIGMRSCIPCETIKTILLESQKKFPEIYWIDLNQHPRMRHVFNFKAIPYLVIYKEGEPELFITGEKNCEDYLVNTRY